MKPLVLRCSCGVEHLDISLFIEEDGILDGYLNFAAVWEQHSRWRDRIKACWLILRGRSHYFGEVNLDREDLQRVHDYLAMYLGRNLTYNFTAANNDTGGSNFTASREVA